MNNVVNNAINVIYKRAQHNADKYSCFHFLAISLILRPLDLKSGSTVNINILILKGKRFAGK